MFYPNTAAGIFLSRPNRFLAHVLLDGSEIVCHVKNTGRLRELLIPGISVAVQFHPDAEKAGRKTSYSLIGVLKETPSGKLWVNIDSQAPNQAAWEWLSAGEGLPFCPCPVALRREVHYHDSRFDLSFSAGTTPWFMEVKGVTLDVNGTAMFPDAPTERGVKHLEELIRAKNDGYEAAALFVIQMKGISSFAPNEKTHPEFAAALALAQNSGVHIWAYNCMVTADSMTIDRQIPVRTRTSFL